MIYYDEQDVKDTVKERKFLIAVCMSAGFGMGMITAAYLIALMYGKGWF